MSYVDLTIDKEIVTITLNRPKVNALNDQVVKELQEAFDKVEHNDSAKVVILTGQGSFFSFGFDVPEFMSYSKEAFHKYVLNYSDLIKTIFVFPKPVIAALNGHTVAGGSVLAMACDRRIMISGRAKIALNEMTFGSTVFSCVTETLKYAVGAKGAEQILYSGNMFAAQEALSLGLVDIIAGGDEFEIVVSKCANDFAVIDIPAFASIKKMLKQEALNNIERLEKETISEFVGIWYSDSTRKQLEKIEIR